MALVDFWKVMVVVMVLVGGLTHLRKLSLCITLQCSTTVQTDRGISLALLCLLKAFRANLLSVTSCLQISKATRKRCARTGHCAHKLIQKTFSLQHNANYRIAHQHITDANKQQWFQLSMNNKYLMAQWKRELMQEQGLDVVHLLHRYTIQVPTRVYPDTTQLPENITSQWRDIRPFCNKKIWAIKLRKNLSTTNSNILKDNNE